MRDQRTSDRFIRRQIIAAAILMLTISALAVAQQAPRSSQLGKIDFATSGSEKAQAFFLRGVAALHSFWFEEALEAFQSAVKIDPDFQMAYWGEAMSYNHPLWAEQDFEAGKKAVAKIKDTPRLSEKERGFLGAVRLLYGEGNKLERDKAYSAAMGKMHQQYPDDLEVASFYALSLLGTVRPEDKGFRRQALAGAISLEVFRKNPDHPGAAHYIIHAFDDPDHAILALPAAYRYSEIAPEAHHARHMPSHIFLQLGMWPEAAKSNESSWATSDAWVKRKNLSISLRDYHSLHWLLYVYCQQGRYSKAEELLGIMRKAMSESSSDDKLRPNYYANNWATMAATFIVETERWDQLEKLLPAGSSAIDSGADSHGAAPAAASQQSAVRQNQAAQILPIFTRGFIAAVRGSGDAEAAMVALKARSTPAPNAGSYGSPARTMAIRVQEIEAVLAATRGNYDEAIAVMKKATAMEEELGPPSGPPPLIKPSHELFGEILLRAGRPKEASQEFAASLLRQPNRARSLIGAARAAAKSGDAKTASDFYSRFLRQWQQADSTNPEIREAQDFLRQARAQ
jgi:tetratricopeptide (TPR) repeat protein